MHLTSGECSRRETYATRLDVLSTPNPHPPQKNTHNRYRFVHSRLIANAEEVAFYGGEEVERSSLWKAYSALARHLNCILRRRIFYTTLEGFCLK